MAYKQFQVDGVGTIKIYKRKTNRSLRLTVAADGDVRITIPLWAPYRAGLAFAQARRAWIAAHIKPTAHDTLVQGLKVGKSHRLLFVQDDTVEVPRTAIRSTEIIITHGPHQLPTDHDIQELARKACWRALRRQALTLLGQRLDQLAALHHFTYRSFAVKRMKTRWGSCDQYGNIVLNLYLIQLPWELIDYVITHELTHTKVLHHGPDFWDTLEVVRPDARTLKKAIKAYRPTLLIPTINPSMA